MTKREKRLEAARNNPMGVRPEELRQILLDAGFEDRTGKGDHRVFVRGDQRMTLDMGVSPTRPVYVRQVLALLEDPKP